MCGREEEGKLETMRKFSAHFEMHWNKGPEIAQNNIKSHLSSKCCA